MGKLHQLLPVETALREQAASTLRAAIKLFASDAMFVGQRRTYQPIDEGGKVLPPENVNVRGTVYRLIADVMRDYVPYMDATIQKEVSNKIAVADVFKPGTKEVLFKDIPVPALLNLEARIKDIIVFINDIPTLDPSDNWVWDKTTGTWHGTMAQTYSSTKIQTPIVLYHATPEHPAQTQLVTEDVRVGIWSTIKLSGAMNPAERRELLRRAQDLLLEVTKARQAANDIEHDNEAYGQAVFDYIAGDVLKDRGV